MKDSEILSKARDLIADPDVWVQGNPWVPLGRHCALTALGHFTDDGSIRHHFYALPEIQEAGSLVAFNDTHTHKEVLTLFDKAIQRAREAEQEQETKA